jgi:phosphoenolpyruvate synthase/pyruvate phosphate dikinase
VPRLLPLAGAITWAGPAMLDEAPRPGRSAGPGPVGADGLAGLVGAKAARLARAAGAGLPVLPGWAVPVAEGGPALGAGMAAVRQGRPAAARRAVLGHRLDDALAAELRAAVARLGGRVIVRSSSPLESDPRWSGAFSSVAEVGSGDVVQAVRSCWASAFAVDPLGRLEACGLPPEALELGVLIQPEIRPVAGGVARVTPVANAAGADVTVGGVRGHPGALLSGWAEGASACVRLPAAATAPAALAVPAALAAAGPVPGLPGEDGLAGLIGPEMVAAVAALAGHAWLLLGDDVIEWAASDGEIWLLQSRRSDASAGRAGTEQVGAEQAGAEQVGAEQAGAGRAGAGRPAGGNDGGLPTGRAWMPLLAATVLERGEHVPGRPGAPGIAAGRLLVCRPHEPPAGGCADAILLVDQPVPALAPLLFAARGVIARAGAAGSHLAEVARSLGVPMVVGCRPGRVTGAQPGPDGSFLAAIDGSTGDVAFLPVTKGG